MKPKYLNWKDVKGQCLSIARQLQKDQWKPDYIVGITRGGTIPATMLSHYLDVPMQTLKVSLRDNEETESNLIMAGDALGYDGDCYHLRKKILLIDDINDTGATYDWIKNDWMASYPARNDYCCDWDLIWNKSVRFSVLVNNDASRFNVDYSALNINKLENDEWIVFPWEEWWKN